jgi:hypothetical protein
MKVGRLHRALLRARPYIHNPQNWPADSCIGKRFRIIRFDERPELVGLEGACELPRPDQKVQLRLDAAQGNPQTVEIALADLFEI